MGRVIDLTGTVFGRLTALRRVGEDRQGRARWLCACTVSLGGCGSEHVATCDSLRQGDVLSCGCLRRSAIGLRSTKHGHAAGYEKTSEYQTWRSMRARCYRRSNKAWPQYGGRGITICDRWRDDFAAFLADMGPKPSPSHSVDRIDNDGPYSPENCRWATGTEQGRNTHRNVVVEYGGRSLCIAEWAEVTGLSYTSLRKRLGRGWTIERALNFAQRVTRRSKRPTAWPTTKETP